VDTSKAGAVVRSVAAYSFFLPSMLSGAAVGLLHRNRYDIVEHGVSTWIDLTFKLTGVQVDVTGEENLWSHRPAVFIYNHRSNFDPYVAIHVVRRDWGSVGKRELIDGPLAGIAAWLTPNVAYVDRSSPEKAIEALRPVTELLTEGTSILIAPEGTRSRDGTLGEFKKGPFRMAITAGVPVVPIVIRNADEISDRGATVIRGGTVHVAVLPPVEVTKWRADQLDARVAEVRQSFLDTLANWPTDDTAPEPAAPTRRAAKRTTAPTTKATTTRAAATRATPAKSSTKSSAKKATGAATAAKPAARKTTRAATSATNAGSRATRRRAQTTREP
jgi:1-acyl-sn-glycerol-3-phosphate acyltransferase